MFLPENDPLVETLVAACARIRTVDAHQHLGPESPMENDACRLIAGDTYTATDLVSAGMTAADRERIVDASAPLSQRWALLKPFWRQARYGSYARAVYTTLRDLYGAADLELSNFEEISARISQDFANPGIFERVLLNQCNIDVVLTQGGYFRHARPLFLNVARPWDRMDFTPDGAFEQDAAALGVELRNVDDLVPAMDAILRDHHAQGAVGFKSLAFAWRRPTATELKEAFARRPAPTPPDRPIGPLACLYVERMAVIAAELDIPVAVHTGAPWTNWLDFRSWEPTAIIPLLDACRETRFDLYHAGIPFSTQASMLPKVFPNAWHNLTWAHIISHELAMRCVAEWLDLVPLNKVIGFGGDYGNPTVALTYGHLAAARRNLARVLGYRVKGGSMGRDDAVAILQAWLSDNPRSLYRIGSSAPS